MKEFKLLINGKLVSGAAKLDVINPATEDLLATAPRADRGQLNEAIAAAKAAFPAWSVKPIRERGGLLGKLADALEARQDEFARLLTMEQGKPLSEARWEVDFTIRVIRHFAKQDLRAVLGRQSAAPDGFSDVSVSGALSSQPLQPTEAPLVVRMAMLNRSFQNRRLHHRKAAS